MRVAVRYVDPPPGIAAMLSSQRIMCNVSSSIIVWVARAESCLLLLPAWRTWSRAKVQVSEDRPAC